MIICCEECGARNSVGDEALTLYPGRLRCRQCNDFLVIPEAVSAAATEPVSAPPRFAHLILKYQALIVEHKGPGHRLTMGRQEGNDLRVPDSHVSRTHATIDFENGKYVLRDMSLNGTYVLIQNRQAITVKNDAVLLVNQGIIGLGCKVDSQTPTAIYFMIGTREQQSL
jgi:hypothetical protein